MQFAFPTRGRRHHCLDSYSTLGRLSEKGRRPGLNHKPCADVAWRPARHHSCTLAAGSKRLVTPQGVREVKDKETAPSWSDPSRAVTWRSEQVSIRQRAELAAAPTKTRLDPAAPRWTPQWSQPPRHR